MASVAYCYYSFEILTAALQRSDRPNLESLLGLYNNWDGSAKQEIPLVQSDDAHRESRSEHPSIIRLRDAPALLDASVSSTPSTTSVDSSNTQPTTVTTPGVDRTDSAQNSVYDEYPMFVTWNEVKKSGSKSLRGCIGTFRPWKLEKGLEYFAIESALNDERFDSITLDLVPKLSCSITLLADFEPCDPLRWDLGTHGIKIEFIYKNRVYNATYLPDVAVEQGWTKEETLYSLMQKAGWSTRKRASKGSVKPWDVPEELKGEPNEWGLTAFKTTKYTGLKATASYSDWQEWQQWAKQKKPELWS